MITIAIVEPRRMARIGIEQAAGTGAAIRVVASVATVADLGDTSAQVVVLSSRAWAQAPSDAIEKARTTARMLLIVDPAAPVDLVASIRAGARGFVSSDVADAELATAINAVAAGAFYLMGGLTDRLDGRRAQPAAPNADARGNETVLGDREAQTLRLLASGYTHAQIGRRMGLTELTVNTYVKRIRVKLNAGNKAELTRKAIQLGYLNADPAGAARTSPVDVLTATLGATA